MRRAFVIFFLVLAFFSILARQATEAEDSAQAVSDPTAQVVPAPAQPLNDLIPGGMEGRVSLDLRNIDVVEALKFLAMKASANIIATKNVAGRITLMVENVPVKDIFDIMLRSNGLAYVKQGEIYNVMTEDEYKAMLGKKFSDIRKVKIFRLKYVIPEQAFTMLDAMKSDVGRVIVDQDSGTVLIMDTPERLEAIEKMMNRMDQKTPIEVFSLKYAKAKDVEEYLKNNLDVKKVGSVRADERSNLIIVQALQDRMEDVRMLMPSLDKKTKQVLIDTKIVKIKLSDELDQGIEWEGLASLGKEFGMMYLGSTPFSVLQTATTAAATNLATRYSYLTQNIGTTGIGAYPFSGNTAVPNSSVPVGPGQLHLGLISNKRDLDALIKYVQKLGKTQVLSNPKLAVINNQEARIHVGERQAYVTTTTTTGQQSNTISEQVNFVDVGIQLAVTPTINDDGYVTMKVKPEVSSVVDTLRTPTNNLIPIIDTSMAETTVMVKDGTTIIIGGLRSDAKTSDYDQWPYLGKIPIIGNLFKNGSGKTERTELLVMMTPHIVSGDKFFTGDDRPLERAPGKKYENYQLLTEKTGLKPSEEPPEDRVKPYKEYSDTEALKESLASKSEVGLKNEKN